MRKTYKKITAFIVLCVLAIPTWAQLSGVYTIDNGTTTYPGGTNFANFTTFAAAINTAGVSGPVVVNVVANTGPYNQQVAFGQIAGMSANNRVTINGNNNLLTFNATSGAPYTMLLNGTDYLSVNNLRMEGTNTNYAMVCVLTSLANNNSFASCTFSCQPNVTSSYCIPFAFNSGTGLTSCCGDPGNYNSVTSSTLFSGYNSIYHYGKTSSPWTNNNSFVDCYIVDWYQTCIIADYAVELTVKGCEFNRLQRTTLGTSGYFWQGWYNAGVKFEENTLHNFWTANPTLSFSYYGFYYFGYAPVDPTKRNSFKNNIVRDLAKNGTTYFFNYNYNANNDYINNTFSWDFQTGSGSTYIFYYCYGSGSNFNTWRNNIFSITQAGTGTKYAMYFVNNTTGSVINNNNYWVNSTNGYVGNWTANATTFQQWQTQGPDQTGYGLNPMFTNTVTGDMHPTNPALNNLATPVGLMYDNEYAIRNQTTPDLGALEFLTPLCTGTPTQTVAGPSYSLCPGEGAEFTINGLSSDLGYTYQWYESTQSNVGQWFPITNANTPNLSVPSVTTQSWYSAVISCTAPGGSSIQPVAQVDMSGPVTDVVRYYEDFEGIGKAARLPNCSWAMTGSGQTYVSAASGNRLPRSGKSFATFNNASGSNSYYYTNPIWMEPNITYSASVWFQSDLTGAANWSDFRIMLATAQTATSIIQTIAGTNGPAISPTYKSLSNTFQVQNAGFYHAVVRGTGGTGAAQYLSWDDLLIEIPCTATHNTLAVNASAATKTICAGANVVINASGATTYTWSTGSNAASLVDSPIQTTDYTVVGTNGITGCQASSSIRINVKQSPNITVFAFPPVVCVGQPVSLMANGASFYSWNTGGNGANLTINPATSGVANYQVSGTNTLQCTSSAAVQVTVNPLPTIDASVSGDEICAGDQLTLQGSGGVSYQWSGDSPSVLLQGQTVNTFPMGSVASFTVVGTDLKGCTNTDMISVSIKECVGINEFSTLNGLSVYPNPVSNELNIEMNERSNSSIQITDVTGRVITSENSNLNKVAVNMNNLAAGVYYVRVQNTNGVSVVKVVKQ